MPAVQLKKNRIAKPERKTEIRSAVRKASATKKVAVERLAWKPVELPDRLEDAEGFYGLEEIEDVDITKDDAGNIEYTVHSKNQLNGDAALVEESDWEGFQDEPPVPQPAEQGPKKKKAKKEKTERGQNSPPLINNAFDLLDTEVQDEGADVSAWSGLGLRRETLSSISKLGFRKPTPIQEAAIPDICAGRDVIGKAPTGSGKTLAYGIPILEHILNSSEEGNPPQGKFSPTAFIICPTRELAKQLEDHLGALCSSVTTRARIATVTGGLAVQKQQRLLATANIVIGTPGRLWDVFNSTAGLFEGLRKIKFLVIDEADRLLSGGHFEEVEQILHGLDRKDDKSARKTSDDASRRQTLVFSATFQRDLQQQLAGKGRTVNQPNSMAYLIQKLNFRDPSGKPKFLDVNPSNKSQLAPLLKEAMLECGAADKDLYLYATLLLQPPQTKTLVFANSITTVRHLTLALQALQLPAHALHSQMPQKSRLQALERFAAGKTPTPASSHSATAAFDPSIASHTSGPILVATDIAARGLDIPTVHLVIHYHAPRAADAYIHRSGRTARGAAAGTALLLCSPDEVVPVRRLAAKVHAQTASERAGLRAARLDRTLVGRLRPRMSLAERIATFETDKARAKSRDNFMREAAEDLGVELSDDGSEDSDGAGRRQKQGGKGKQKDTQAQVQQLRAELKEMLRRRVNVGVSERYLTAGGVDVDAMLKGQAGAFIGHAGGLEID